MLNVGLGLKKVHRAITFNQDEWLKPYIEINGKLRTEAKNKFEKDVFKLMNNSVFGKNMENQRNSKIRDTKLVTTEKRWHYLVSETNYYPTKFFTKNLLAIEMEKTHKTMNEPVYLDLLILDLSNFGMII